MAVTITSVLRRLDESGGISTQAGNATSTETCSFQVTTTEKDLTPLQVANAVHGDIPKHGQAHSIYPDLLVTNKNAQRATDSSGKPNRNIWIVKVDYAVPQSTFGGGATGKTNNSINIQISVTGQETSVYTSTQKDENESTIVNSAGDLYPEPIEMVLYDEVINVTWDAKTIDMQTIALARGMINDSVVNLNIPIGGQTFSRSFAKHTLLLKSLDYNVNLILSSDDDDEPETDDPKLYPWHKTMVLIYRPDTWNDELPQKGYRYYVDEDDGSAKLTEYKDTAVYLDSEGYKLQPGQSVVTTEPVQKYFETDLAAIINSI